MDLASSPDWWLIGTNFAVAVGTIAVAVIAALGALREARQSRKEIEKQAAAQARLVTSDARNFPTVTITNHSGLPLLDARVVALAVMSTRTMFAIASEGSGAIAAGESWSWQKSGEPLELPAGEQPVPTVEYVDAVGVTWQRAGVNPPERKRTLTFTDLAN